MGGARRRLCAALAAAIALAAGASAGAEEAEAGGPALPDPFQASRLSGDWGGARRALADRGLSLDLSCTLDVLANVSGGTRRGADALGSVDLALEADLGTLVGWSGAQLFLYGLGTAGGDPSDRVGDLQIVDNVEAFDTWKLYEAWLDQSLAGGALSLRAGLYAVDREFDVLPAASPLLNSSFGTGADLASSGRNGPSIFPVTSVAARLELRPVQSVYARAVVADGVPGDPGDPRGTRVRFDAGDGVFLAGEIGVLNLPDVAPTPALLRAEDAVRPDERRYGYFGKFAVGVWGYTTKLERFQRVGSPVPRTRRGTAGAYVLAEQSVFFERSDPLQGLSVFARGGLADDAVNPLDGYLGGGLVYRGALPGRGGDRLALGVAAAHLSRPFRTSLAAGGRRGDPWEVAVELTYLARLAPGLSLQPDVQLVLDPGRAPGIADAWVVGGRLVASF